MSVKWHGCRSDPKDIHGGGPQGATLGLLEYMSQSNHSANCVDVKDRFKFVDDLSILEIVNLLTVGITSFNIRQELKMIFPLTISLFLHTTYNHKSGWMRLIDGQKTNKR